MNAVIFLNYQNDSVSTLGHNLLNAGSDVEQLIIVKEKGIANAINVGLNKIDFSNIEYVTILGNDILEPNNWLTVRNEFLQDKSIGICSIPLDGFSGDSLDLIGNFTITKEAIKRVGAFNQELDPYGAIDLDYCTRVRAAGLHTKFVPSTKATHLEQNGSDKYGYNKMELVKKTWDLHNRNVSQYTDGTKAYYIPL
jgi:GT2 family glycosyltransferase